MIVYTIQYVLLPNKVIQNVFERCSVKISHQRNYAFQICSSMTMHLRTKQSSMKTWLD